MIIAKKKRIETANANRTIGSQAQKEGKESSFYSYFLFLFAFFAFAVNKFLFKPISEGGRIYDIEQF